jgi:hypothetical protein
MKMDIGEMGGNIISIQEKLQSCSRLLTHLFNGFENSQKATDAVSSSLSSCLQEMALLHEHLLPYETASLEQVLLRLGRSKS